MIEPARLYDDIKPARSRPKLTAKGYKPKFVRIVTRRG
jgi:hypothetical protein